MRTFNFNIIIAITIGLLITSCGKQTQNENAEANENADLPDDVRVEQSLYDEVIAVHDEVMPKMENIMKLKGELVEKADLLREEDANAPQLVEMETAIKDLESADEAMMHWMRNFQPQRDNVNHDAVVEYYTKQKISVDSVKMLMENALIKGKELANKP
jgi:hypothetical protein